MNNGPVTAYVEIQYSPYYKYLADQNRTISYYHGPSNCWEEAKYFNKCWREGYMIDMPSVQGTIFIDNCYNELTCFGIAEDLNTLYTLSTQVGQDDYVSKTEKELALMLPWQHVLIEENYFYNNWANIIMDYHQT